MKLLATIMISLFLFPLECSNTYQGGATSGQSAPQAASSEDSKTIKITQSGSRTSRTSGTGQSDNFTGSVRVEPLFTATDPSHVSGSSVTFQPGARTAWHTHMLGQHLIVTVGAGWVQQEGGKKLEMKAGDVVWTPPNVKHWHGGTATSSVTHIAIQQALNGRRVEWFEKVSDEIYNK